MNGVRYCPLCDAERPDPTCPIHLVPTILPREGQPPNIVKGSLIAGRYRIEGVLSHGGMGTVLDAEQLGIKRRVVVKILRGTRADDRPKVRRFYLEAQLVSTLDHPNVVSILEFGVDPNFTVPFIAMERIEGVTLQRLIEREGPLPERRAAHLFSQIVRALAEAHGKGVLHRDLKPRNIMVRRLPEGAEHVTVLDFGLAKLLEDDNQPPLTAPGRTVGTPGYMSPEQVLGRKLDGRSDLYGVGCMLYTALVGQAAFEGAAALVVMRKQVREQPPPLPRRLSDGAPPSTAITRLLFSMLEKHPDDRPRSLDDVRLLLDRIADGTAGSQDHLRILPAATAPGPMRSKLSEEPDGVDQDDITTIRIPQAESPLLESGSSDAATIRVAPHRSSSSSPSRAGGPRSAKWLIALATAAAAVGVWLAVAYL